jgi:hypothetical protein
MDGHHVGEVFSCYAETPYVPVEKPDIASAVARQEAVPHVRVAMNDGHGAAILYAPKEARRALEQQPVEVASFPAQTIAEPFLELSDLGREPPQKGVDGLGVAPTSDRLA